MGPLVLFMSVPLGIVLIFYFLFEFVIYVYNLNPIVLLKSHSPKTMCNKFGYSLLTQTFRS